MNFRRYYIPNSIVFITQIVDRREPIFSDEGCIDLLRSVLRNVKELHPFAMMAYVFLPDHFHLLIKPTSHGNFSKIMQSAKSNFTYQYKQQMGLDGSLKFWQKRFHDHIMRDEQDLRQHLDYIHYNPVKHQYVRKPEEWTHSSFSYWKERGAYADRWGWSLPDSLSDFTTDGE